MSPLKPIPLSFQIPPNLGVKSHRLIMKFHGLICESASLSLSFMSLDDSEGEIFEVEKILDHTFTTDGKRLYYIKWRNYEPE